MNSIYKVIWSKAKNCYVVASEIAKSHTKSASGSEKMGGYGKKALLALAAASAIFCGGLVNVGATVHVDEVTGGANEVYTTTEVNTALDKKADKDSVYSKADTLSKTEVNTALDKKADKDSVYSKADTYSKTEVNTELAKKADAANVFTKDQTYTRDQVNTKLADYAKTTDVNTALAGKANVGDSYTKAEADGKFATSTALDTAKNELDGKITANTAKITANETAITNLNNKAATTDTTLTNLSGRMTTAESDIGTLKADVSTAKSDIGTLKADMTTAKSDIGTLKADVSTAKSDINSLKMKDTELTGKIEAEIANRITSDTALDNKIDTEIANRITSDTALDNKIDAEIANRITSDTALDNKIDTEIQDRKDAIKATNDRTGGIARNLEGTQTTIEGIVKVDNQGNVKDVKNLGAETITTTGNAAIGGALGVTGETTLDGALTAKGEATFEKNVIAEKDLTVNGKLNVGEIYLENNKLEPTGKKHDSATSITADGISNLAKVTEHGHTTESQFTHNEKGTFNHAKDGNTTDWKESTSNVTADGVENIAKDSKGNNNTFTQTSTDTKNILKDKDGNTSTTRQDSKGIYGYAKDKDGNKSYTKQEGNRIAESVIGQDGKQTKSEMTSTDITNTAKDGTITNDAKDIVNNATGNMTNTVGGNLSTTVGGNEIHEVKGTKTETVEGKVTENFKGGQETYVTGDQTTNVSGTQTTTATDINRNASSSMVDKVDNAYGTNTETKEAGKTTTDVSIKGTGEKGQYIRGANESRDYLIKGTLMNSETKTAEATSTEITDGTNKASTRQDAKNLAGSVTNGTEIGVSGIHANDDGSVSIDSAVAGGGMSSVINQKKDSIQSAVGDGTNSTVIHQDKDNVTIASSNGTVAIAGKDIVNNASESITNKAKTMDTTVTGKATESYGELETTVNGQATENFKGGLDTNVTGTENHTVDGDQNIHVTGKQTNKIDGDQVNTIGGNQTTTVTGDISNTAKNITNEAETKLTDKVGANTRVLDGEGITDTVGGSTLKSRVTQKKGSIEAVVTDGTSFNHSRDIPVASTKTLTGYGKMNQLLDDLNSSTKTITDGTHKTSKVQTALDITNTAADGTITNNAKNIVNNATGDMTNTVGGKLTTTVTGATEEHYNGGLTTNVTGEENHTVTGNQNNKVTGKQTNTVEGGQENIISGGQTNTITGGQINNITGDQTTTITGNKTETVTENVTEDYKKNLTTTVGGNEIHEVKGTKTETVEGKVIENFKGGQETNVTGNQDIHVTGKQTNKIDGNQENTIGGDQTTNVTGDISNTAENITNAAKTSLTDKVGTNTRVITSRSITDTVGAANRMIEDGKITDNAGDFTVTTDKENGTTFTNAGSTASSFTTVDGTNTGSAQEWTNIKGNEISTGKVEANYVKMDYADVMNDLGVKGTTTTKTLKVTENATVGGTLDVTQKATFHDDVDITKNLSVGGNATIAGDVTARSYKVDGKTYIDANGINANDQKITNVADGSISEGSKDAVNGGQLYGVKRDLEHQVDKVGANAAAMANLRPMEFDPSSKWNIAAAIGNYGSETAAALGAFYRPNDNVMVNLSTAFGTGENMVGGGVSVRLGKGGNKLSREETNALKAQVADLTARMDALLSVLNPNMSKDFPDVPENHWAYEAVSRLAGNDIVQGYPDGEFHGERTMTRYEMAEIIYNALSRGAEAERKLVEEFKPELQAMAASEKATAEKAEG